MEIKLEIELKPTPHQSVRFTKSGFTYQPKKIVEYKTKIIEIVREQLSDDFSIIEAGTFIHITKLHYVFKYPQSFSKKKRTELDYKPSRPDLHDNLNKALFDALEGLVFERDQDVVSMDNLKKYYGDSDKILIDIRC